MNTAKPIAAEVVSTPSRGLIGYAESRLLELAEDGKTELVRSLDGLVSLAQEIAAQVESVGGGPFAGYARQAAGLVDELQGVLRDRPVGELLDDGRDLVRRQPAIAVGVAVVAGFIAARLFKSGIR
jgi:hypothetical protein